MIEAVVAAGWSVERPPSRNHAHNHRRSRKGAHAHPSAKPEDKFSFGLWTVGYAGRDPFGDPTRAPLDPVRSLEQLSALGAYGINFHDDDLVPFGSNDSDRQVIIDRFKQALADTNMVVTTATTNLFTHPVFKDGGFTSNDRAVRRYALAKVLRNIDLAAELGAKVYVAWGGREGAESGGAKDLAAAFDRYREAFNVLSQYVIDKGYDLRFAIEPKAQRAARRHPAADGRARARVHHHPRPPRAGRRQPRDRPRADGRPERRTWVRPGALAGQAVPHRPQRPERAEVRPGPALRRRQRARRLLGRRHVADRRLRRPGALRLQAARTEDDAGVWVSAAACMRNYLILREKAIAFRADPQVQQAMADARVPELSVPTLADGEGWAELVAADAPDIEALGARGMAFEQLDQLALEHLYGVRG
jgi:xylose isomerase